jgi:hypothetical protein
VKEPGALHLPSALHLNQAQQQVQYFFTSITLGGLSCPPLGPEGQHTYLVIITTFSIGGRVDYPSFASRKIMFLSSAKSSFIAEN